MKSKVFKQCENAAFNPALNVSGSVLKPRNMFILIPEHASLSIIFSAPLDIIQNGSKNNNENKIYHVTPRAIRKRLQPVLMSSVLI